MDANIRVYSRAIIACKFFGSEKNQQNIALVTAKKGSRLEQRLLSGARFPLIRRGVGVVLQGMGFAKMATTEATAKNSWLTLANRSESFHPTKYS